MFIIIPAYAIIFAFLISTLYYKKFQPYHLIAKTLNSLAFVIICFWFAYEKGLVTTAYFLIVFTALTLCMIGDILLAVTPNRAGSKWFLSGVVVFLTAHLVFCFAFSRLAPFTIIDFMFPFAFVLLIFIVSRLDSVDMGDMLPIVTIYSFFVALLCSKSITLFLALGASDVTWLIMSGALLFCLSDFILIFIYFCSKEPRLLKFFNLLSYYTATFLLALSAGAMNGGI